MQTSIETDILVTGGGLAGCFAAIAAKRTNPASRVFLVEKYGFLGGMATAGFVFPYMSYKSANKRLVGGLFKELNDRLVKEGFMLDASRDFPSRFDSAMLRCVLDTMVIEAGVDMLFHGLVNCVETRSDSIDAKKIVSETIQTKAGSIHATAKWYIDATGNADIVFHAGGKWVMGRESDGLVQPATLNFRVGNIGMLAPNRQIIGVKIKTEKKAGNPLTPRDNCLAFDAGHHQLHFNQTRVAGFDFTDPFAMTAAEIEGRKQASRFIHFLRDKIPGYKRSTVVDLGTELGLRETRRIVGEYVLTEQDLLDCKQFPDRIGLGNYSIDIHDPKGTANTDIRHIPAGKWYSIPFRSLIPKDISNLLVAGRPISATHVAHSAIRILPTCSAIGHAAGVAAGLIAQANSSGTFKDLLVAKIQSLLRDQGAVLE
nr:FAD-dependent oxidoreductase [Candidatus Sigynarchaeota archaeon]